MSVVHFNHRFKMVEFELVRRIRVGGADSCEQAPIAIPT